MKEEKKREGYEWIETKNGGFWVKMSGAKHAYKKHFFCPCCQKITGSVDDSSISENGVCLECIVNFVEDRSVPLIDLEIYRKKAKEL